ncbi:MAG: aminotransferase class V-fold PLP-dependent enzyme [Proteobacteria bacterium]|nr:aminotransferase class V-fold PLP-dependent enzyme [Pseudomonadota bacterium]
MHKRLFIPGPTEVRKSILEAMATPMIGHRFPEFDELFKSTVEKVQKLLYTKNVIFVSTSSSTGLMEGAMRNCVSKRVLSCVNGAFSKRWAQIAEANGKEVDRLEVEWGKAVKPEMIDEKLKTGKYDAISLVLNETSTGVYAPIAEIAEVMKKYPDVIFMVDAVSCMAGTKIEVDKLGIDVVLAGVQKAFALPPGLAVAAISKKAMEKAKIIKNRGYYFDFLVMKKYYDKWETPATPSISHIYALDKQMSDIFEEGLDNRFKRHLKMAEYTRNWAKERGFTMFSEEGHHSPTVSCINNTKGFKIGDLNAFLAKKGAVISNGYGILKEKTFRIAHMGDTQMSNMEELLYWIDEFLSK